MRINRNYIFQMRENYIRDNILRTIPTCIGIGLGIISSSAKSARPVTELIDNVIAMLATFRSNLSSNKFIMLSLSCTSMPHVRDVFCSDNLMRSWCAGLSLSLVIFWLAFQSLWESSVSFKLWSKRNLMRDLQSESDGNSTQPRDRELNLVYQTEHRHK